MLQNIYVCMYVCMCIIKVLNAKKSIHIIHMLTSQRQRFIPELEILLQK